MPCSKSLKLCVPLLRRLLAGHLTLQARLNFRLYATQQCERSCSLHGDSDVCRMQETSGAEVRNGGRRIKESEIYVFSETSLLTLYHTDFYWLVFDSISWQRLLVDLLSLSRPCKIWVSWKAVTAVHTIPSTFK